MRTILFFIRTIGYLIGAIPDRRRIEKLIRQGDMVTARLFLESRVRVWALAMLRYAGVTVEARGLENMPKGPVLILPNHQSDWDIPVVLSYVHPCGLLAKKELAHIPLAGKWMDLLGCIYIDRSDIRQSVRALQDAGKVLDTGRSFVIFPEGTRSKSDEIGEFKDGAFRVAIKKKIPIVPVSIDGTYRIMEANRGSLIRPARVKVTILPPIDTAALSKEEQKHLGSEIRNRILNARDGSLDAESPEIPDNIESSAQAAETGDH